MNFDFSDEQKALKDQLRRTLAKLSSTGATRGVLENGTGYDAALWSELGSSGWLSAAVSEDYGGQGLGHETLCCIAEELGRALAPVPVSSSIFLVAEAIQTAGTEAQKREHLPALGSGKSIGAFALVESAGPIASGGIAAEYRNGRLSGAKTAVTDGLAADIALVVARESSGEIGCYLAPLTQPGVEREREANIDPSRPQARIAFRAAAAEPLGNAKGWGAVQALLRRAAIPTAFEQLGGADICLQLAADYARQRFAFGRQIGSYQAVKHRLADVYLANELARSNAYYGAWALQANAADLPLAAATARVAATDAFERAARDLTQTLGGIAATWAHDAHLYYRRSRHLALALGAASQWRSDIVGALDSRISD